MNMINRNITAAPPASGVDLLAVLDQRLLELQDRRDAITGMILQLEKTWVAPASPAAEQANALLDGKNFDATNPRQLSQLAALHAERTAIDKALEIGRQRQYRLATERAGEIWAQHFEEIAAVEKRRLELAFELQAHDRKREDLREKIRAAGGSPYLTTDGIDFLGLGDVHSEQVNDAAERLIKAGILTSNEVRRMSRG